MRIDRLLVERGLFESRAQAQAAIAAGLVTADDAPVRKPSEEIAADAVAARQRRASLRVARRRQARRRARSFRLRSGRAASCLDVGASTGGFTEVLLARGARRVYAVDVGRGQLHAQLRDAARDRLARADRHPRARPGAAAGAAGFRRHRRQLHLAQARAAGGARPLAAARAALDRADQAAIRSRPPRTSRRASCATPRIHAAVCDDIAGFVDIARLARRRARSPRRSSAATAIANSCSERGRD